MFSCKLHQQRLIHTGSPGASVPLPQRDSCMSSDQALQGFTQLSYRNPSDETVQPPLGLGPTQIFWWERKKKAFPYLHPEPLVFCYVCIMCGISLLSLTLPPGTAVKSTAVPPSSLPVVLRMLLHAPAAIPPLS